MADSMMQSRDELERRVEILEKEVAALRGPARPRRVSPPRLERAPGRE
jgi:hypothetical protein